MPACPAEHGCEGDAAQVSYDQEHRQLGRACATIVAMQKRARQVVAKLIDLSPTDWLLLAQHILLAALVVVAALLRKK